MRLDVGLDAGAGDGLEDGDDLEGKVVGGPTGLRTEAPLAGIKARPEGGSHAGVVGKPSPVVGSGDLESAEGGLEAMRDVPGATWSSLTVPT